MKDFFLDRMCHLQTIQCDKIEKHHRQPMEWSLKLKRKLCAYFETIISTNTNDSNKQKYNNLI